MRYIIYYKINYLVFYFFNHKLTICKYWFIWFINDIISNDNFINLTNIFIWIIQYF